MPSDAWKRAAAASRAAAAVRAAAAAARSTDAAAAAARSADAGAGAGAVNHPSSRYHLVRDPSLAAYPRPRTAQELKDEKAYLPKDGNRMLPFIFSAMRGGGYLFNTDMRSDKIGMPFEKEDLESEETLWALYNRWLSYFNVLHCSPEKVYRFNIFKEKARMIYERRGADPERRRLNHLSDVGLDELCHPKRFRRPR